MEKNFTNENFEEFLKQNAEGLRMLPSDKVWKGISTHFKKQKRRFGLFVGIGLMITAATGYYIIDQSIYNDPAASHSNTVPANDILPGTTGKANNPANISSDKITGNNTTVIAGNIVNRQDRPVFNNSYQLATEVNVEEEKESAVSNTLTTAVNDFTPAVVDDTYPANPVVQERIMPSSLYYADPLTIESVVNSFSARKKRVAMQIYFSPTVSYRMLRENTPYIKSVSPNNIPSTQQNLYDINEFVTHKPAFGFELGMAAKYRITKNMKLKAGLQFNVNRYDIKVFNSSTQVATIRLNNRNRADSLTQNTNYSNTNGYKANWLENFYFQVSAPVGVEYKIKGDEKVEFGLATTVQPTYVLGERAYLISTDYKNYAEVPWLIRRWNVNTSLETYVSYSTGRLKWQVGPQVRYQLLSSFVKKYPVKENLFDFGLKVGIGLNKQ